MYNLETGEFIFNNPVLWIDFALTILMFTIVVIFCNNVFRKKIDFFFLLALEILTIVFWFFSLKFIWTLMIVLNIGVCSSLFINGKIGIKYLFKTMKRQRSIVEKVYDKHEVAQKVVTAVEALSRSKTGALITFEQQDKLSDIVKSGTMLDAPITPELLTTIFYPGTRLHDGAVVIRRDLILAASVYYTPTTKPLTGKFGSRHRAAIGISEKTDSITIIVSEETGRISIAYKGELIQVLKENLLSTLEDYLNGEMEEDA